MIGIDIEIVQFEHGLIVGQPGGFGGAEVGRVSDGHPPQVDGAVVGGGLAQQEAFLRHRGRSVDVIPVDRNYRIAHLERPRVHDLFDVGRQWDAILSGQLSERTPQIILDSVAVFPTQRTSLYSSERKQNVPERYREVK